MTFFFFIIVKTLQKTLQDFLETEQSNNFANFRFNSRYIPFNLTWELFKGRERNRVLLEEHCWKRGKKTTTFQRNGFDFKKKKKKSCCASSSCFKSSSRMCFLPISFFCVCVWSNNNSFWGRRTFDVQIGSNLFQNQIQSTLKEKDS